MNDKTQALLMKSYDVGEVADEIHFLGESDTRLDEIIGKAKELMVLAQSMKAGLQNAGQ